MMTHVSQDYELVALRGRLDSMQRKIEELERQLNRTADDIDSQKNNLQLFAFAIANAVVIGLAFYTRS